LNAANRRSAIRLRTVAELYPEIADAEAGEDPLPSCSAAEALERQEPFINQVLATSALAMLRGSFATALSPITEPFTMLQQVGRVCWGRSRSLEKDTEAHSRNFIGCTQEAEIMSRIQVTMKKSSVDPVLALEAKMIVALAFRNGPIEDLHAGKICPTCSADRGYSRISDEEMKGL